jgi:heat-inducible transcriptional repressor
MSRPTDGAPHELGERQAEVLRFVVRHHIQTGEPVGSGTVARTSRLHLSPASIRGVMAELEERGLLGQPHTSAGRVPTDRAFRFYVDGLGRPPRVSRDQALAIESALVRSRAELPELLGAASRELSRLSHRVGIVLAPDLQRLVVDRIEFVPLDGGRVVAILVAKSGLVHNRLLELDEPVEAGELERIGRYLSEQVGGRTLPEMRELLRSRLHEDRATYDRLMARSLDLGCRALEIEAGEAELFVEGAANLLELPEFADLDLLRSLFRTLEEKRTLIDLLGRVLDGPGLQVVIGHEHPWSDQARCSLVASKYRAGERVVGTVGVVGPTRMAYPRVIALVEHLAAALTRVLSDGEV